GTVVVVITCSCVLVKTLPLCPVLYQGVRTGCRRVLYAMRQQSPSTAGTTPRNSIPYSPDFRKLKLTHNGAKVPDESTEIRKVHCEVFFPLPLATAESHCTALLGSSAQLFEPLQR